MGIWGGGKPLLIFHPHNFFKNYDDVVHELSRQWVPRLGILKQYK